MRRREFIYAFSAMGVAGLGVSTLANSFARFTDEVGRIVKTDAEWKQILTPEQYTITRRQGTEAPYSSPLLKQHGSGTFDCVCCSLTLFSSKTKFESGTGWPSFWAPIAKNHVSERVDNSLGISRTEVRCARCEAHLGHVFDDGPQPTGLRYCMNGVALKFTPSDKPKKQA